MMYMAEEEWDSCILDIIMTQYALKSGLRKFRKRDEETVTKELTQLHVLETFSPVYATKLTKIWSRGGVVSNIYNINHNGDIKGREF